MWMNLPNNDIFYMKKLFQLLPQIIESTAEIKQIVF